MRTPLSNSKNLEKYFMTSTYFYHLEDNFMNIIKFILYQVDIYLFIIILTRS